MIAQLDKDYIRTRPTRLWNRLVSYGLFEGRPLTTRGRWFNPVVFANLALGKCLPLIEPPDRPIFILGTGRSGTTVLGMVLSMHRDIGYLNEPKALWHVVHGGEDLVGNYSDEPGRYRLGGDEVHVTVARRARRLYRWYMFVAGARRVVDKYPEMIFRVPFLRELFPGARFLFLARNGWETISSIESWSKRLGVLEGADTHDWWGVNQRKWSQVVNELVPEHADLVEHADSMHSWTNHLDMAAVEWILTMREGLKLEKASLGDILRIEYSDLCRAPRETLEHVRHFSGLRPDPTFVDYAIRILKSPRSCGGFALNPAIMPAFVQTMEAMGYLQ